MRFCKFVSPRSYLSCTPRLFVFVFQPSVQLSRRMRLIGRRSPPSLLCSFNSRLSTLLGSVQFSSQIDCRCPAASKSEVDGRTDGVGGRLLMREVSSLPSIPRLLRYTEGPHRLPSYRAASPACVAVLPLAPP